MKKLLTLLSIVFILAAQLGFAQSSAWDASASPAPQEEKPKVLLYPNPLVGQDFKVQTSDTPSKIVVINAIGQTVYADDKIDYNFDLNYDVTLNQPEKGLYLVKVEYANKKSVVKKLLIK